MLKELFVFGIILSVAYGDCKFYLSDSTCSSEVFSLGCIDTDSLNVDECSNCDILGDDTYISYRLQDNNPEEVRFYTQTDCNGPNLQIDSGCEQMSDATSNVYVQCDITCDGTDTDRCPASSSGDGSGGFDEDLCPEYTSCASPGDECELCVPGLESQCENFCGPPYKCKNGTCQGIPDVDDSCNDDDDCDTASYIEVDRGYTLECTSSRCTKRTVDTEDELYPGDKCENEQDCRDDDDNDVTCTDGRCEGSEEGRGCDSTAECNPGTVCISSTCVKQEGSGTKCDDDDANICENSDICVEGECVDIGSLDENERCQKINSDQNVDSACEDGLYCDGICVEYDFVDEDDEACTTLTREADCGTDGECGCDHNTGDRVCIKPDATCRSELRKYGNCLDGNDCHVLSPISIPGSCAYDNCRGRYSDYLLCLYNRENDGDVSELFPSGCYNAGVALSSWLSSFF